MVKLSLVAALVIAATTHLANAQNIPATVQQAEVEGAAFAHEPQQLAEQALFNSRVGGTADRRCMSPEQSSFLSLRSGDFIVRGLIAGTVKAGKERKVLWFPLHGSASWKSPLVIRAARVGDSADSIRVSKDRITHGGGWEWGYPSSVSFPTAGQWIIVATAGNDWGCFVVDVDPANG